MRRVVLLVLAVFLFVPVAVAQDEGTLRDRIGDGKSRERSLASAADRLGELERKATREVVILEGRLGAAQQDLNEAETRLAATEARETAARRRVTRLRERLSEVRDKLSGLLRERYMGGRPDFVTVVLHADGFPQLLETLTFVKRVERADTRVLDLVRDARGEAGTEQRELERLAARQARERTAVLARRNALASITAGLRERRDTISRAHAARVAALNAVPARAAARPSASSPACSPPAPAPPARPPPPAARGPSRGRSSSASPAARTSRPTTPAPRATTSSCRRPGRASADRPRTRTRPPRPSRTASRRACGPAARAVTTGSAPTWCSRDTVPSVRELSDLPGWAQHLLEETRVAHLGLLDEQRAPARAADHVRAGRVRRSSAPSTTSPSGAHRPGWRGCAATRVRPSTVDRYDDDWTKLAWVQVLGHGHDPRHRRRRRSPRCSDRYPAYRRRRRRDR